MPDDLASPLDVAEQSALCAVSALDRAIAAAFDLRVLEEICFAVAAALAASPRPPIAKIMIARTTSISVSPRCVFMIAVYWLTIRGCSSCQDDSKRKNANRVGPQAHLDRSPQYWLIADSSAPRTKHGHSRY